LRRKKAGSLDDGYADVRFFDTTDSIDENTKYILNERLQDMKRIYDKLIQT
jgi:hypothetical protein